MQDIALLRGINVGGKNKLPMKDLVGFFLESGCSEVRSYIQSGNVVYSAPPELSSQIPGLVSSAIRRNFGYQIPIIRRTRGELVKIVKSNPFLISGVDEKQLYVAFLSEIAADSRVTGLDPFRFSPDEFRVSGSEIYLRYPNGLGRSRMTNIYFDASLGVVTTIRNWRTTRKLLELAQG